MRGWGGALSSQGQWGAAGWHLLWYQALHWMLCLLWTPVAGEGQALSHGVVWPGH